MKILPQHGIILFVTDYVTDQTALSEAAWSGSKLFAHTYDHLCTAMWGLTNYVVF